MNLSRQNNQRVDEDHRSVWGRSNHAPTIVETVDAKAAMASSIHQSGNVPWTIKSPAIGTRDSHNHTSTDNHKTTDTCMNMVIRRVFVKKNRLRIARLSSPSDLAMDDTMTMKSDGGNQRRNVQNTWATG